MSSDTRLPVVILCGGQGARMGGLVRAVPKPMLRIGKRPLLHHLMSYYSRAGMRSFILALGYLGWIIKDYFLTLEFRHTDILWRGNSRPCPMLNGYEEADWTVMLAETGADSGTAERLLRTKKHLGKAKTFCLTYGDGLCDVPLDALLAFHRQSDKAATITAVHPAGRFGGLALSDDGASVHSWCSKDKPAETWINGGFMICERRFLDYVEDECELDNALANAALDGQLASFRYEGNWACADTPRDLERLRALWKNGQAFWQHPGNCIPEAEEKKK